MMTLKDDFSHKIVASEQNIRDQEATLTLHQQTLERAKESLKSRLFNSANHTVIANTATEIEALKDRPFIPERHILGL